MGLDFEKLCDSNVRQFALIEDELVKVTEALRKPPITYQTRSGDAPSQQLQTIANEMAAQKVTDTQASQVPAIQESLETYHKFSKAPFQWQKQIEVYERINQEAGTQDKEMIDESDKKNDDDVDMKDTEKVVDQDLSPRGGPVYTGVFALPEVLRSEELNREKDVGVIDNKPLQLFENTQLALAKPAAGALFGNKKLAEDLVIGDGFNRISRLEAKHYFNTAEQELQVYRTAMSQYQADGTFDYYLNEQDTKARDHKKIEFRDVTVEGFVAETILHPIHEIFRRTSKLFLQRYLMSETE